MIRVVFQNAGLYHRGNDIPAQAFPGVLGVLHAVLRVDPDQNIVQTLAIQSGLQLVVPGFILQNGMVVKAFASAANVVVLYGFVNAVTD